MADLLPRQKRFIDEYLIDLNATQAAIRAGYSPRCAAEIGYENLRKPHIYEQIKRRESRTSLGKRIPVERLILELERVSVFDPAKAFDENGNLIPIHQMDEETRAAINYITEESIYEGHGDNRKFIGKMTNIKQFDKVKAALELMKRYERIAELGAKKPPPPDGVLKRAADMTPEERLREFQSRVRRNG